MAWAALGGAVGRLIESIFLRLQVRLLKKNLLDSWIHLQYCEHVISYQGSAKGGDTRTEKGYRSVEGIRLIGMNITSIGEFFRSNSVVKQNCRLRTCSDL